MVAITVRNVPDEVRNELAVRAARSGRSLQEYLLAHLVEFSSQPTVDEIIAAARERARLSGIQVTVEQILEARDADRR
ncbi:MAG TPA: hypothetical protein VFK32_05890 [Tepidiformaceae bacterium]|nr:hypothetical protein [Tepidiformaceae bacterium]